MANTIIKNIYSNLKISALSAAESHIQGADYLRLYRKYRQSKGNNFVYKNPTDKRAVAVRVLTQVGFQITEQYWHKLQKLAIEGKMKNKKKEIEEAQKASYQELISAQQPKYQDLGTLECEGGQKIFAYSPYGEKITDALIIHFNGEDEITVNAPDDKKNPRPSFKTKTRFFYDIMANVSQTTDKEIILTKVQGRDYSRKELVAGGDISFSVSGMINSNMEGVYPSEQVSRFIEIMKYNGIVGVNHYLFKQFNVDKIIIQSYKLDTPTYKNIQPYSFTCVAVEPDSEVTIEVDTINIINNALAKSSGEKWYEEMLDIKKRRILNVENNEKVVEAFDYSNVRI